MEVKLKKLADKLILSDTCIKELDTGKLIKIVGNKDKTKYNFYIELENNITIESFMELKEKLCDYYNNFESVNIIFNVNNLNYDLLLHKAFPDSLVLFPKGRIQSVDLLNRFQNDNR